MVGWADRKKAIVFIAASSSYYEPYPYYWLQREASFFHNPFTLVGTPSVCKPKIYHKAALVFCSRGGGGVTQVTLQNEWPSSLFPISKFK